MQMQLPNPAAILLRLILLAAFVVIPTQPAAAQAPVAEGNDLFLPLVASNSAAAPTGLYAQLLQRVAQHCGATGLNQICYVSGTVSLGVTDDGFNAPGAVADLTDGATVSVISAGGQHRPVERRLAAPARRHSRPGSADPGFWQRRDR